MYYFWDTILGIDGSLYGQHGHVVTPGSNVDECKQAGFDSVQQALLDRIPQDVNRVLVNSNKYVEFAFGRGVNEKIDVKLNDSVRHPMVPPLLEAISKKDFASIVVLLRSEKLPIHTTDQEKKHWTSRESGTGYISFKVDLPAVLPLFCCPIVNFCYH